MNWYILTDEVDALLHGLAYFCSVVVKS